MNDAGPAVLPVWLALKPIVVDAECKTNLPGGTARATRNAWTVDQVERVPALAHAPALVDHRVLALVDLHAQAAVL